MIRRKKDVTQRCRDLPEPLDPVGAGEQRVVAEHGVVEQALVALEVVGDVEGVAVAEGQRGRAEAHLRAGLLGQEVDPDHAGVGELEGQLVGARRRRGVGPEHPPHGLLEAERDGVAALGQRLAGPQLERHSGPARGVDSDLHRREGLDLRVGRDPGSAR
jgi:hypothetical protein